MLNPTAAKIAVLAPKLAFVFLREAAEGLANACDVVMDTARIELYGLGAGASDDELAARRKVSGKDEVLRRAVKIAGEPATHEMSKDDLVREAMNHAGG